MADTFSSLVLSESNSAVHDLPDSVFIYPSSVAIEAVITYSGMNTAVHPYIRIIRKLQHWNGTDWDDVSLLGRNSYLIGASGTKTINYSAISLSPLSLTDGGTYRIFSMYFITDDTWSYSAVQEIFSDMEVWPGSYTNSMGTNMKAQSFAFYSYVSPVISSFVADRCDADGTPNEGGEKVKVTIGYSMSPIGVTNTKQILVYYRLLGDVSWTLDTTFALTSLGWTDTQGPSILAVTFTGVPYEVKAEAIDLLGSTSNVKGVAASIVTYETDTVNHKFSVGKRVEVDGPQFDVAEDARFGGDVEFLGNAIFSAKNAARNAMGIYSGILYFSVSGGGSSDYDVVFKDIDDNPITLSGVPIVVVSIERTNLNSVSNVLLAWISKDTITDTGFHLRVTSSASSSATGRFHWIALEP